MFKNIQPHVGLSNRFFNRLVISKIGAILIATALAGSAGATDGPCPQDALKLRVPETIIASVDDSGSAWFEVELPTGRFVIAEAQPTGLGRPRPEIQILDGSCRPMVSPKGLSELPGRGVVRSEHRQTAFIEVRAESESEIFILDLWADSGASSKPMWTKDGDDDTPVPPAPIDEWDEIVADTGCAGRATKDGDDDAPVPPAPIDEWDELRGSGDRCDRPADYREIQGFGLTALDDERGWRPWCPWANRVGLLGTLTCARQVHFDDGSEVKLHRLLDDRAEMLVLRLDRPGRLEVKGVGSWSLRDADGRTIEDAESQLSAGTYFLEAHAPDPAYSLVFHP